MRKRKQTRKEFDLENTLKYRSFAQPLTMTVLSNLNISLYGAYNEVYRAKMSLRFNNKGR